MNIDFQFKLSLEYRAFHNLTSGIETKENKGFLSR